MEFQQFRGAVERGLELHQPGINNVQVEHFIELTVSEYLTKVKERQDEGSGKEILRPIFAGAAAKLFRINPAHDAGAAVHIANLIIKEMSLAIA